MTSTVEIIGIAHVGIRVHDLERSREFYERLGFAFVIGPVGPEPVAVLRHPAGIEINLVLNASNSDSENVLMDVADKHAGYTHVALAVNDLDAATAMFAEAGIPLSGGPNTYPGGSRGIFVRDPDNNVVELYSHGES